MFTSLRNSNISSNIRSKWNCCRLRWVFPQRRVLSNMIWDFLSVPSRVNIQTIKSKTNQKIPSKNNQVYGKKRNRRTKKNSGTKITDQDHYFLSNCFTWTTNCSSLIKPYLYVLHESLYLLKHILPSFQCHCLWYERLRRLSHVGIVGAA